MHSSRMHTTRLLTISPSMHSSGGVPGLGCTWSSEGTWSEGCVPGPRGVDLGGPGPRGDTWLGLDLVLGCTWSQVGVHGPRGFIWSQGEYLGRYSPRDQVHPLL